MTRQFSTQYNGYPGIRKERKNLLYWEGIPSDSRNPAWRQYASFSPLFLGVALSSQHLLGLTGGAASEQLAERNWFSTSACASQQEELVQRQDSNMKTQSLLKTRNTSYSNTTCLMYLFLVQYSWLLVMLNIFTFLHSRPFLACSP